jgi:hypothetical protein
MLQHQHSRALKACQGLYRVCFTFIFTFTCINSSFCLFLAPQPPVGQGLLVHYVSRSHATTHHIGRTPLDEWSAHRRDLYLTTHNTHDRQPCPGGIRTHNLSRRAAADLRLRQRGHWDRRINSSSCLKSKLMITKCSLMKKRYSILHVISKAGIPQCIQLGRPWNQVSVTSSGRVCSLKRHSIRPIMGPTQPPN